MARRTKRIALLLLAGAIVNVVVAWGIVLLHGPLPMYEALYHNPLDQHPLMIFVTKRVGHEVVTPYWWNDIAIDHPNVRTYRSSPWWASFSNPAAEVHVSGWPLAYASGWPLLALTGRTTPRIDPASALIVGPRYEWGIAVHEDLFGRTPAPKETWMFYPMRPLWRGVIGNTLFYATLLWLPFCGAPNWRRARRHRRGLCVRCAYPVGDGERCSECGTPVPARRARPV